MNKEQKNRWYEKEFNEIHEEIKDNKRLSHYDFLRIRNFKLRNSTTEDKETIMKITSEAFELASKDDIIGAVNLLRTLDGVAVPIASTILAMRFPDRYAIIDINVIKALGKEAEWGEDYTKNPEIYEKYLLLVREKARKENMKLRDYEVRLFKTGQSNKQ